MRQSEGLDPDQVRGKATAYATGQVLSSFRVGRGVESFCKCDFCCELEGTGVFCVFCGSGGLHLSGDFIPGPGLEPASKKDGGNSLSFHDFAFGAVPPLAEESGLLWTTSNKASKSSVLVVVTTQDE